MSHACRPTAFGLVALIRFFLLQAQGPAFRTRAIIVDSWTVAMTPDGLCIPSKTRLESFHE